MPKMRELVPVITGVNYLICLKLPQPSETLLILHTGLPNVIVTVIHSYHNTEDFFFMDDIDRQTLLRLRTRLWESTFVADIQLDNALPSHDWDTLKSEWEIATMRFSSRCPPSLYKPQIKWRNPELWYTHFLNNVDNIDEDYHGSFFTTPPYNPIAAHQLKIQKKQSTIDELEKRLKAKKRKLEILQELNPLDEKYPSFI